MDTFMGTNKALKTELRLIDARQALYAHVEECEDCRDHQDVNNIHDPMCKVADRLADTVDHLRINLEG